jgi:hypothetical protein
MERLPLVRRQREIALDHQALGNRRIAGEAELRRDGALVHLARTRKRRLLAVEREAPSRDGGVLEGAPHQPGRDDGTSVVREPDGACVRELGHLRQLGAFLALRDRGKKADGDFCLGAGGLGQ